MRSLRYMKNVQRGIHLGKEMGILFDNDNEGNTVIGVDSTVLTSITCTGIEVVTEEPLNPVKNKMYFVLNQDMYLSKVQMNGITLFEI